MTKEGLCAVCSSRASQKCANCQLVFYCSRDHQKADWKRHRAACGPVRVRAEDRVGRYLEATRDIRPGDVVLRERALITGPAQVTPPVCLGCYKELEQKTAVPCVKCGWPMCGEACAQRDCHEPECNYTVKRGEKVNISEFGTAHPSYQSITVLRILYQRDHNAELWSKLQTLESHTKERRGTERWNSDKAMIVEFIQNFLDLKEVFDEELIMKCCGIIQVNAHEVPLSEPCHIALYDRVSMLEHDCRANCGKSFTSAGDVLLVAGLPIKAGSHISVCYTDPLWGTEARRHHLAETKFFECACDRCKDNTEMGTMFSAVKCQQKSCKGYVLPKTFIYPILSKNTDKEEEEERFWACDSCQEKVKDDTIQKLLEAIGKELNIMPKDDIESCQKFIEHCGRYLHPHHYHITDVAIALAQMIGQTSETGLAEETNERIVLKIQLCTNLATLLETLVPAETRARGSILFELHAAIAETGRRKSLIEGPLAMLSYITESRKVLAESASLLSHEPPELPEGRVGRQAVLNLVEMDKLLRQLSAALPAPL